MDPIPSAEPVQSPFALATLGAPTLRGRDGQIPVGLGSGKPLALLCFLVVRGEVRRDEALALLWGDVEEERARNAFRQALHRLRLALGDDVVVGDRQVLRISAEHHLRADVAEFERAIDEDRLDDAIALYGGDFLDGFDVGSHAFDQWVEGERARLRAQCASAAERAAQKAMAEGRVDDATAALRKLLIVAPSESRTRSLQSMIDRLAASSDAASLAAKRAGAPLLDHATELARLLAIWNAIDEESGATIVIEGTPGVGQSRLVQEFVEAVAALGSVHILHAVEGPQGFTAPYAVVATALRPLVRAPGVAGASPHLLAEAARLIPELRDAFQLPAVESAADEDTARLRICEGTAALLEAAAYERPICLVIENVHHSPAPTLELLGFLTSRLRRTRVAILLTFDPVAIMPDTAARVRALAGGTVEARGDSGQAHRFVSARHGGATVRSADEHRVAAFVQRHFPHWRYLVGGAVATTLVAIVMTAQRPVVRRAMGTSDTLLVARAQEAQHNLARVVTGSGSGTLTVSEAMPRLQSIPAWADSIDLPWVNPMPAPNGRFVALERITPRGSNLYLISADRRDTVPLAVGDVEAFGMGWSPDGAQFLVTRRRNIGSDYQMGLFAFPVARPGQPMAIDTSDHHSVTEAAWSPDGSHIGWVARVAGESEEVFVSWADGSRRRNVSTHQTQDDHIAWSPDGSLIAFTSRRDGNAELYAYDFLNERLRRVTNDLAHDDRAAFDRDGRFVAFESTRGGAPDVYVMSSLGGAVSRVGDSTTSYRIVGWRRAAEARYLDRLDLGAPSAVARGDTVIIRARGSDQVGAALTPWLAEWTPLDSGVLRPVLPGTSSSPPEQRFVAMRDGLARVAVNVGAWRTDTAYIRIGDGPVVLLDDEFAGSAISNPWRLLGQPLPTLSPIAGDPSALLINADRQWESGVLSSASVPIQPGLTIETVLHAPFGMHAAATSASLALVAPDPPDAIDVNAPRFLRLVSLTWNADAQRLVYAAEREVFVESVPAGAKPDVRTLGIVINSDGTVTYTVDGALRWRSTVRVYRTGRAAVAQVWLGGQDSGPRVAFGRIRVVLANPR
jgi:DNA-binding SARP family transcriptional activator